MKLNDVLKEDLEAIQADINKCKDLVLDQMKDLAEKEHYHIDDMLSAGWIDMGDIFDKVRVKGPWTREHDLAVKHLERMRPQEWEKLFKDKFGMTDIDLIKKLEKEGEREFETNELKFIKDLGKTLTVNVTIKDFDVKNEYHLKYYMKSLTKIVIDMPHHTRALYTNEMLEKFGMNIEKVKEMFARFKINQSKRPVYKKSPGSLYDSQNPEFFKESKSNEGWYIIERKSLKIISGPFKTHTVAEQHCNKNAGENVVYGHRDDKTTRNLIVLPDPHTGLIFKP